MCVSEKRPVTCYMCTASVVQRIRLVNFIQRKWYSLLLAAWRLDIDNFGESQWRAST